MPRGVHYLYNALRNFYNALRNVINILIYLFTVLTIIITLQGIHKVYIYLHYITSIYTTRKDGNGTR